MADIRNFAPYIYDIKLRANEMEFILPCNQHNWIDCNILENNCKLFMRTFLIETALVKSLRLLLEY